VSRPQHHHPSHHILTIVLGVHDPTNQKDLAKKKSIATLDLGIAAIEVSTWRNKKKFSRLDPEVHSQM
jgi:hypothetical protein